MGLTRRHRGFLIAGAAALLAGAVVTVAAFGKVQFGAALFSGIGSIVSLLISGLALATSRNQAEWSRQQTQFARSQAEYAGEQARLAALATTYAYQPILLPVHDAVRISKRAGPEPQYPAVEAFSIPPPEPSDRVLLMDQSTGRAVFRLRNVGRGPALIVSGQLSGMAGNQAALQGNPAIGPDQEERYSAMLDRNGRRAERPVLPHTPTLAVLWKELTSQPKYGDRTLLLQVKYRSSAPDATMDELEAVFDPRGTGRWHTELIQAKTPAE